MRRCRGGPYALGERRKKQRAVMRKVQSAFSKPTIYLLYYCDVFLTQAVPTPCFLYSDLSLHPRFRVRKVESERKR